MLRASSHSAKTPLDLRAVSDRSLDPLVPGGRELLTFTDAVVAGHGDLKGARRSLVDAVGAVGASAAARTCGNFEMMNRLVDATGIPISARLSEIAVDLGLPQFGGR